MTIDSNILGGKKAVNWKGIFKTGMPLSTCFTERGPEAIQLHASDLPENMRFLSKISPVNIPVPLLSHLGSNKIASMKHYVSLLNIYMTPIILRSLHNITFIRFMRNNFLRRCCKESFELKANAKNNKFYKLLSCFRSSEIQISWSQLNKPTHIVLLYSLHFTHFICRFGL